MVAITCNNYNPPSMSFQDWVSRFSVQPRELILPFPYYFLPRPRNKEREKIKERERERFYLLLPCFSTIKRETKTKLLPPLLPFLIFDNREERKKNFSSYTHFFFDVVRKERKTHFVLPPLLISFSFLSMFERLPSSNFVHG